MDIETWLTKLTDHELCNLANWMDVKPIGTFGDPYITTDGVP